MNSCNLLTKKGNDMINMNKLYVNLNKVKDNLNNCGVFLSNQIKFSQGNEEFKTQQQELMNSVKINLLILRIYWINKKIFQEN